MSLAVALPPRDHNQPPTLLEQLAEDFRDLVVDQVEAIADRAASLPKKVSDDIALGRLGDVVKDARKLVKTLDTKRSAQVEPHLTAQREINGFFKATMERLDKLAKDLELVATDYQVAKDAAERRRLEEEARKAREEEDRQRQIAETAAAANRKGAALRHDDRADEAAMRANRIEAAAKVSAADLTRVRSSSGTVSTTRTAWDFEILDAAKIPLDALRPYIARADLEKAIRSFVKVNKDTVPLAGVRIFQDKKAAFR